MNKAKEIVFGFLVAYVGDMFTKTLRLFLRFITGSSVRIGKKITVEFNHLYGFTRWRTVHTCDCILELPVQINSRTTAIICTSRTARIFVVLVLIKIPWKRATYNTCRHRWTPKWSNVLSRCSQVAYSDQIVGELHVYQALSLASLVPSFFHLHKKNDSTLKRLGMTLQSYKHRS